MDYSQQKKAFEATKNPNNPFNGAANGAAWERGYAFGKKEAERIIHAARSENERMKDQIADVMNALAVEKAENARALMAVKVRDWLTIVSFALTLVVVLFSMLLKG